MSTFDVRFLGCKVSQTDAQELREELARRGHVEAEPGASVDVAVVNTCCVTHEAVRKSRRAARRAAARAGRVYVTGCAARLRDDAFAGLPKNVEAVSLPSAGAAAHVGGAVGDLGCVGPTPRRDRVRAFVKIQDGCSFGCSFCVIPSVRGSSRSRTAAAVLAEIERRVAQGHPEIVLTGINLGLFRDRAARIDLPRLIRLAGRTPGLRRLRLSSIEVNHLTDELVAALRETPIAARHLHVPLQSGDENVLRAMRRRYDAEAFLRRLRRADGFNLTSDVIVGFPTEDEPAFERTLRIVAAAGITKVHVFPYSPRPDTATAGDDPVPRAVKKERSARLRAAAHAAEERHWARKVGGDDLVLVDRPGRGYGDDYSPWLVEAPVGSLVRARATGVVPEGVVGVAA